MADSLIDDRQWQLMMGRVSDLGGTQVRVGVLGDDSDRAYPERANGQVVTVGEVTLINEYGSRDGHVPAREFIRSTFRDHVEEVEDLAAQAAASVIERGMPAAEALNVAGARGAELMQRQILDHPIPPPNRPSTIAQKGSDHPLLDTGLLAKSISHMVVHESPLSGDDYEAIAVEEVV